MNPGCFVVCAIQDYTQRSCGRQPPAVTASASRQRLRLRCVDAAQEIARYNRSAAMHDFFVWVETSSLSTDTPVLSCPNATRSAPGRRCGAALPEPDPAGRHARGDAAPDAQHDPRRLRPGLLAR